MYEVGFECYNILNFNFFYHNEISFIESLDADNHYVLFHDHLGCTLIFRILGVILL